MAITMKYSLQDVQNIIFNGFDFVIPDETLSLISSLALQVGSPNYVRTPVFQKRDNPMKVEPKMDRTGSGGVSQGFGFKKKRGNKGMEVLNDDDWENLRNFQTTKIEEKAGLDAQVDIIRSYLNKMSDKNYIDMRNNIVEVIEQIKDSTSDMNKVGVNIFEIASNNRFYSKMYADLYSDLITNYDIMKEIFEESFDKFMELFDTIEYVEPALDYDKFCRINKENEKRKSLSSFFINLMVNGIISKKKIINLLINLLRQTYEFISVENKKNEVDELTENVSLLYKKDLFTEKELECDIGGMTISELIKKLANSKAKTYLSLTNKSIFKFMDMIEM